MEGWLCKHAFFKYKSRFPKNLILSVRGDNYQGWRKNHLWQRHLYQKLVKTSLNVFCVGFSRKPQRLTEIVLYTLPFIISDFFDRIRTWFLFYSKAHYSSLRVACQFFIQHWHSHNTLFGTNGIGAMEFFFVIFGHVNPKYYSSSHSNIIPAPPIFEWFEKQHLRRKCLFIILGRKYPWSDILHSHSF